MHNGTMADMAVFREPGGLLGKGVDDRIFLDVGTVADFDITKIPPENGPGSDIAIFSDGHPADQNGGRMDKRGFPDLGPLTFEFVKRHFFFPLFRKATVQRSSWQFG